MTAYKLHNVNGRFDHAAGKAAAIARANEIDRNEEPMTEAELRECGWTFSELTPAQAREVGL